MNLTFLLQLVVLIQALSKDELAKLKEQEKAKAKLEEDQRKAGLNKIMKFQKYERESNFTGTVVFNDIDEKEYQSLVLD